ncbi:MAG: HAMP domain-containing protein, partial [Spirochaetes bacterium]
TVLIFTVVLFGFAMLMVVGLSRVITNPINESIDFAWGFAKGDLGRRIINYNDDEIGRLQSALNSLADALQDKINGFLLEQNKLAATVQSIHEGIALIDTRKRIVLHNRAFSSFLTIDQEILDRNYYEAIRSSSLNAKIEYALSSSVPCSFEEELRSGITCEIYITPISGEHELNGVLIVLHDVTERKRIVKLKTELVGNLSHELKTPITILKGYLETLRENRCDKDTIGELIDKALASVERQNSIINDMLKLNMLETTRAFQDEDVDLRDVIENCLNILTPKVREKRIVVAAQLDALPGAIRANRFLAEEILFNIIDNGINYNRDDGSLTIVAQLQHRRLALEISDTGIGIPPESLDRVFERFYRVNKSRSRATGGTGLGLSIVKHAAELIAWQISVKSTESGSTFTIEIPIEE